MRAGWWPEKKRPPFPLVLGTDGSGTIAAVGSRVRRFAVGDRVYSYSFANPKGGFYAQFVTVAAEKVGRPPAALTMKEAGAIATTGLTALQGVDDVLQVKRGETVVIHGASGGVGTMALQFAKMRGARVLATASGNDGLALVKRLGADEAVDGRRKNLREAALRFAPDGVDAVLAFAGGKPLAQVVAAVRRGGRIAYPNGVEPVPRKRRGVTMKSYDGTSGVREFERLGKAVEAAKLKVPIAASFSLRQAAKAHRRLEAGHVLGKIVLRVKM
jgi:NADPH:quinone reductase-like Zn-dependent oxidoreductase